EYDFVVAPGADTDQIALRFDGATSMDVNGAGDLVLHLSGGDVVQHAPVVYQDLGGVRTPVAAAYALHGDGTGGLTLGAHDAAQGVTIDPVLTYSTFLGGSGGEVAWANCVDASGNVFVAGTATSGGFPTTSGAFQTTPQGDWDIFVAKLDPTAKT